MKAWNVDKRDRIAQEVHHDAELPPSEGGRFSRVFADTAREAIDFALGRTRWTEQQERLLRAAQDVVNDAEPTQVPRGYVKVAEDMMEPLKAIVKEISDDAVKEIEKLGPPQAWRRREPLRVPGACGRGAGAGGAGRRTGRVPGHR